MAITCLCTRKTYSLGVENQLRDEWAFFKGKWRKLKSNYRDEDWFEDYQLSIAETKDMLECWLSYLPGCIEWDDYGDFSITFDMNDVKEAGWNERQLIGVVEDMARFVKMRRVIHGEKPWPTHTIDDYGHRRDYFRYPAIDPLEGMLDVDYPSDLDPTG